MTEQLTHTRVQNKPMQHSSGLDPRFDKHTIKGLLGTNWVKFNMDWVLRNLN